MFVWFDNDLRVLLQARRHSLKASCFDGGISTVTVGCERLSSKSVGLSACSLPMMPA